MMAQQRLPKPKPTQDSLVTVRGHDLPQSLWSQKDVQEACLMRYFVDELAQWVGAYRQTNQSLFPITRLTISPSLIHAIPPGTLLRLFLNGQRIVLRSYMRYFPLPQDTSAGASTYGPMRYCAWERNYHFLGMMLR